MKSVASHATGGAQDFIELDDECENKKRHNEAQLQIIGLALDGRSGGRRRTADRTRGLCRRRPYDFSRRMGRDC
jgi:hypothetical protein